MEKLEQVKSTIRTLLNTIDGDFFNFMEYVEEIENKENASFAEMQLAEVLNAILSASQM